MCFSNVLLYLPCLDLKTSSKCHANCACTISKHVMRFESMTEGLDQKYWDIIIASLVVPDGNDRRGRRAAEPGFDVFEPDPNENFVLSAQGEHAKAVAMERLHKYTIRLQRRLDDLDFMDKEWQESVAYNCFIKKKDRNRTYNEFIDLLQGRDDLMLQFHTIIALWHHYNSSSISVADHKAIYSIQCLSDLIDAAMEGFLVSQFTEVIDD